MVESEPHAFRLPSVAGLGAAASHRCRSDGTAAPRAAIVYYSTWTAILTLLGGFDRLSNMAVFGFYLFYCSNVVALILLRRETCAANGDVTY